MTPPTAIVTGGSSGIGEALVHHLVSMKWRVVIADVNPPKFSIADTIFIQTNIASWQEQADMFKQAYSWNKRLDFVALNAGVDDRDDIFNTLSNDVNKPPSQPNTRPFDVNVTGTYYGIKLAAHYITVPSMEAGKPTNGGKIVITSSGGGIFPIPILPQYTGSKHALVGLVRALARNGAASKVNIRINAVCPAIVDTPGLPAGLVSRLPPDQITPMSTIIRCFDTLADLADVGHEDWVLKGKTGQTVEGNGDELIYHHPPERQGGKFVRETGVLTVAEAYREKTEPSAT
ncbi:hypothetical protein H2202_007034 [Exophiala xenobiotica]|nr:hypothetical protein H2202_007034 [Exophiala xenobiotica]KAK5200435.1 hypothetical protein LTR92_000978 [Exophiala xenobiotica]KAK5206358.1 hypothetical protein LTR41_007796 [Exophiala xenobiotica]KAK5217568.1 hypothetical protein LTR72_009685 [Exophiala xenobiotica]KAK5232917.1 hypothetical protein LTR47_006144 [Exophiala xenobiotica]